MRKSIISTDCNNVCPKFQKLSPHNLHFSQVYTFHILYYVPVALYWWSLLTTVLKEQNLIWFESILSCLWKNDSSGMTNMSHKQSGRSACGEDNLCYLTFYYITIILYNHIYKHLFSEQSLRCRVMAFNQDGSLFAWCNSE